MSKLSKNEMVNIDPKKFRDIVRKGEWTDVTMEVCQGFTQANLAIVPEEYAFEFLLFCNRNPRPCPVLDVTEPGDPHPRLMAPESDLRTDVPLYRVYKNGELVDEPIDIVKYWRKDLVAFLLGCSRTFVWALIAANIAWRRYGAYSTNIPCNPVGRFRGHLVVGVRAFYNSDDATRALQISTRYPTAHGAPVHIGDPEEIGIDNLGMTDPFHPYAAVTDPPKPGEIVMYWGCGITPQRIAVESKLPLLISHSAGHMFVTDRRAEETAAI
jgi:uncharacterized protein YcsI (UPF0317 family)